MAKTLTLEQCRDKLAQQKFYMPVYIKHSGRIQVQGDVFLNKKEAIREIRDSFDPDFDQYGAVVRFFGTDIMREE